jgi:tetratricopeptide (TPR) repeat protein
LKSILFLVALPLFAQTVVQDGLGRLPLEGSDGERLRRALESRDYIGAETLLVHAIEAHPDSPELLAFAARVFLLGKDPMNAAIAFKKAERIRPLDSPDRFSLAMAYLGIGKGAWARPELEKLAAADPGNTTYMYWIARIDYDEHKYDEAVRRLREVTRVQPGFMKAWDNLALSLEGAGALNEAVASYRQAVRLNREGTSHSPWPPLNLGTLLTRMDSLEDGETLIREAIGYDPGLAEAHFRLGTSLHKQKKNDAAIAELKRAAELDAANPQPFYILGQIYLERGDKASSTAALERFKELKKRQRPTPP